LVAAGWQLAAPPGSLWPRCCANLAAADPSRAGGGGQGELRRHAAGHQGARDQDGHAQGRQGDRAAGAPLLPPLLPPLLCLSRCWHALQALLLCVLHGSLEGANLSANLSSIPSLPCQAGQEVVIVAVGNDYTSWEGGLEEASGRARIGLSYAKLCQSVRPGQIILMADGNVSVEVLQVLNERELLGRWVGRLAGEWLLGWLAGLLWLGWGAVAVGVAPDRAPLWLCPAGPQVPQQQDARAAQECQPAG
jgi:hypothetical protein